MVVCPRCSHENEDSALDCASCGIRLHWALENPPEAGQHDLERVEGPPPEAQAGGRAARGFWVIVLVLAIPAVGILAFLSFLNWALSPHYARSGGDLAAAGFGLLVAVVGIPAAIVVLLRRRPRPNLLPTLRILALIGVTGGLLFGLLRLALAILPEHTARSLIIQYKLGERDFRGAQLEQADLTGADLHEADLSSAGLTGARLTGALLYRTNLSDADLGGADLAGANLAEATLHEADLHGADLTGAQLFGADLRGADLRGANLTKANLFRMVLPGADLSGAAVTKEQLDRAQDLAGTILPDGSVHE